MDFEKDFREWYFKTHCKSNIKYEDLMPHHIEDVFGWFDNLALSFRWGVIVDFFDEKGIRIQIEPDQPERYESGDHFSFFIFTKNNVFGDYIEYKTRHEARKAAYEKAKEIYEQSNQEQ